MSDDDDPDGTWADESDWELGTDDLADRLEEEFAPPPVVAVVGPAQRRQVDAGQPHPRAAARPSCRTSRGSPATGSPTTRTGSAAGSSCRTPAAGSPTPRACSSWSPSRPRWRCGPPTRSSWWSTPWSARPPPTRPRRKRPAALRQAGVPGRQQGRQRAGESDAAALWSLGLGQPHPVSAMHGRGVADLLDAVLEALPEASELASGGGGGPRRVALVGKPNVGKSSLLNRLAGDERSVVHDVAGTTVDPVDSLIELDGKTWRFVDTAGLRRKVGQASGHEFYASVRTHGAIDAAEVVDRADRRVAAADRAGPAGAHDGHRGRAARWCWRSTSGTSSTRTAATCWTRRSTASWRRCSGRSGSTSRPRPAGRCRSWCPRWRPRWRRGTRRISDRPAEHVPQGDRGRDAAAGARRQAAADPVRHPGDRAAADVRAVHHAASWRPATGGSSSAGCGRRSASRAARSGSTCGCGRSAAHRRSGDLCECSSAGRRR